LKYTEELIIRAASIKEFGGNVYYFGPLESSLHFATRQVKILNLLWVLIQRHILRPGSNTAVVGGDVGGVTAAAGLRACGCNVDLFEPHHAILKRPTASHRYVHPTIGHWPWMEPSPTTELPFLEWYASSFDEFIETLAKQTNTLLAGAKLFLNSRVEDLIILTENEIALSVNPHVGKTYQAVFVCDDFGEEITEPNISPTSYWANDDLERTARSGAIRNFVISGSNDMALTDALRLSYNDSPYLAQKCPTSLFGSSIALEIASAEARATAEHDISGLEVCYTKAAAALDEDPSYQSVASELRAALVREFHTFLVTPSFAAPFAFDASPILKLLVAYAIRHGAIKHIAHANKIRIGEESIEFERSSLHRASSKIIVRHGSNSEFNRLFSTEEILRFRDRRTVLASHEEINPIWTRPFPVPEGELTRKIDEPAFIESRYLLAQNYVAREFGARLAVSTQGYILYGPERNRMELPSYLFGIPVQIRTWDAIPTVTGVGEFSDKEEAQSGNNIDTSSQFGGHLIGKGRDSRPGEMRIHLGRIQNVRQRIALLSCGKAVTSVCFEILNFLETSDLGDRHWFTFEEFCQITNRTEIDNDILAAINLLAGSGINALKVRLFFENDNRLQEIFFDELETARRVGGLIDPRSKARIQDFEQYIVPFFTLGPGITGANR
jgi:hypothetical protein